ncbi:DEAD/DEAH box helicase [Anaerophilus nitritogenes]|uniref:DEAD/DEAH box helicase n=1 Tax=Anaerophilus nitritogenes TaxID=2498136 RepID=UPI00101DFF49|nr:DEAD/DEAH box helicase [Anaerophilus nitritogenes]
MKFEELNISQDLKKAIQDMGFEETTQIQEESIPIAMQNLDMIGQSKTGSGKTLAFAIPVIEKVKRSLKHPQAIILCPTRELAVQVTEEFRKLTKHLHDLHVLAVFGGDSITNQIKALKKGVQIVIGTPGRVMDHMNRKTIKFDDIHTVVLDEADEMLNMGFREDIESILDQIHNDKQMILFSATMPKGIIKIAQKYQKNPKHIKIQSKELTTDTVEQYYLDIKEKHKFEVLTRLIDLHNSKLSLIFCNTKKRVDDVSDMLMSRGYSCDKIHGDIKQTQRLSVLSKFDRGMVNILVATDVAARGIDIDDIEMVYNYDIPENEEYYVHRIGRTGRAGRSGKAISLVNRSEQRRIHNVMQYTKKKIKKGHIPSIEDVNSAKISTFLDKTKQIIDKENLDAYIKIIQENTTDDYSPLKIAAALLTMNLSIKEGDDLEISTKEKKAFIGAKEGMDRLYMNVGKSHQVRVGDLLGAITGETNIPGNEVGTIDMFDKYSFVEIPSQYTKNVIKKMNQKRIKGRKVNMELSSGKKR